MELVNALNIAKNVIFLSPQCRRQILFVHHTQVVLDSFLESLYVVFLIFQQLFYDVADASTKEMENLITL